MDGIQPYSYGTPARPRAAHHTPAVAVPVNPAAVKTPGDYLRAVRQRFWVVMMLGVPLAIAATVWVLRQPSVYQAEAWVRIESPQYDPALYALVSREVGSPNRETVDRYLPNLVAQLKTKYLAERVVNDPAFLQGEAPPEGAAEELLKNLSTKYSNGTNWVKVTLEGTDPARTARQLSTLLDIFTKDARSEVETKNDDTKSFAMQSINAVEGKLRTLDKEQGEMLQKADFIGPDGTNVFQAQYESVSAMLAHKKLRLDEIQQQAWVSKVFPNKFNAPPDDPEVRGQIAELNVHRRRLTAQLQEYRRLIKNFESDPSVRYTANKLKQVLEDLDALKNIPKEAATDPSEMLSSSMREDVRTVEESAKDLLNRLKDSMPDHQKFLALQEEREQTQKRLYDLQSKLYEFETLSRSQMQKPPVQVLGTVAEPVTPVRPRRLVNILVALMLSFGLGVGLVCLLEHVDHTVKVPEHLSIGLTLPLLGVIPRIRRTSLVHRGGHLWTTGDPGSVEADAYRNLRASLLGAADRLGPITTLLVTSAKAGEGKSTTALNLAATCARAGERTLLMDVDLRRPSLRGVFEEDQEERGLVNILRGEMPWQRALVRTDLPNLDFLPTGDASGIPIEILGTIELRQLLIALAGHYDRVILDGPAVLGLADCRMLGRVVDASLMVVRSGSHEMRPLQRAKAMLEQSHVMIAGVVFNGLADDLGNWSSYGPYTPYALGSSGERGGIGGPGEMSAALPLTGAYETA